MTGTAVGVLMKASGGLCAGLLVSLTRLAGRERELADPARLIRARGLVTLAGAGGVGETRLAVNAAAAMPADPADGIAPADLNDLTAVADAALFAARTIAVGAACLDAQQSSGRLMPERGAPIACITRRVPAPTWATQAAQPGRRSWRPRRSGNILPEKAARPWRDC